MPAAFLYRAWTAADAGAGLALLFPALFLGITAVRFWVVYVRDTRIPHAAVESLHLEADERELTIEHTRDLLPAIPYDTGATETTIELPTDDDVRDAGTALRSVGFEDLDDPSREQESVEYDYRVETRDGVVFCGVCDSQVSPTDDRCPSCDARIRVERTVETA